jgi:hypothetical protein
VPILRGTREAFGSIARLARWETRRVARERRGPVRDGWPALAASTPRYSHEPPRRARGVASTPRAITERDALELLRAAGLAVVETAAVPFGDEGATLAAASAAADRFGWPVAVKIDAPGFAHKTDAGGVALGVPDRAVLAAVLRRMRRLPARGVLVQPMGRPGLELIVGARRDPQLGPIVLVGIGGVLAEVLDDVAVRLAPVTSDDVADMLDELRGARLLHGVRGRPAADRGAVADLVVRLGTLMLDNPTWVEVDLNPVIAGPDGVLAVDALIVTDVRDPDWDYEDPGGAAAPRREASAAPATLDPQHRSNDR